MSKPTRHRNGWRIRWASASGPRKSETYRSYAEAERALRAHEAEEDQIRKGLRRPTPPARTMNDAFDAWEKQRAPQKNSGHNDVSILRRHLRPFFGGLRLDQVDRGDVDRYVEANRIAKEPLSNKTIANHVTLLLAILRYACDLRWLLDVPRIKKPKFKKSKAGFAYLRTREQVDRLLEAARVDENPVVYPLYATAVFTGLREGELAGLRWVDADFEKQLIFVQRGFAPRAKGHVDAPKSGETRHVPIVDALLPILRTWRDQNPLDVVFPSAAGTPLARSSAIFQETLLRVTRRAGFADRKTARGNARAHIRFHDLRHTFASHWMMNGGDLYQLRDVLGHGSVEMTQVYAHLAPHAFAGARALFGPPRAAE